MVKCSSGSRLYSILISAALLMVIGAGCAPAAPPKPMTVPASGKVMYKGQPVSGASVAFLGDGKIVPALAKTNSEGRFTLTTTDPGDGAVPGLHQVTVTKIVNTAQPAAATGVASMEDAAKQAAAPPKDSGPESLLPDKYSKAATSGLSFEVKATGTNDFTIELSD